MDFPRHFSENIVNQFGRDRAAVILEALNEDPPVSIRVNPPKIKSNPSLPVVPWSKNGFYLSARPSFVADPLWHAGCYYVQEPSSMIIGSIIETLLRSDQKPIRVLDLCAAPGGKSLDIISNLRNQDLLVSNEVIKSRANILLENVSKWGFPNHLVTNNDPSDFSRIQGFFDIVVIDAPCSGEGMFRKDINARNEWSQENVVKCSHRQERIISDAWSSLIEGGYLIYSTCTFNEYENENILSWLQDSKEIEPVELNIPVLNEVELQDVNNYRLFKFIPGQVAGEGFSFFIVQKAEQEKDWMTSLKKKSKQKKHESNWLKKDLSGDVLREGDQLIYYTHFDETKFLEERLRVLKSGLRIGEFKKKDRLVPSSELALSTIFDRSEIATFNLEYDQIISYLRNETFDLGQGKGYKLITFKDQPLGFINHVGARFNNQYPTYWRIRTNDALSDPKVLG